MIKKVVNILKRIGLNWAIAYTTIGKIVQAVGNIFSIVIIGYNLTPVEQGFFYTFVSILALQLFFELGLTGIITQYVAYEKAFLSWEGNILTGDKYHLSRVSSLLKMTISWFSVAALLLFIILVITGNIFFSYFYTQNEEISWQKPWILISFTSSLTLIVLAVLAYYEGLGKIKEIAKIRMFQQTSQILILIITLNFHGKLFSSGLAIGISVIVSLYGIYSLNKKYSILSIWKSAEDDKIVWKEEILPLQWRIAISWISGYLMYQLFNPVIFATEGPIIAGKMGMSLTVFNGISAFSASWLKTKVPIFSEFISKKQYESLDELFNRTLKQSSLVCAFFLISSITCVSILQLYNIPIGDRFLPLFYFSLLAITVFCNQFIYSLASYLRCHKKEPFLLLSIIMGILTSLSIIIFGHFKGSKGIIISYFLLTVFGSLPSSIYIFYKKKKEWH